MKKYIVFMLALMSLTLQATGENIKISFERSGTDAASVAARITTADGAAIEGATATVQSSHAFKATAGAVTSAIICPNVNGNTRPTITLSFTVNGLPAGFSFNTINADIHALNGQSNYQENGDGVVRQFSIAAKAGGKAFGSLNNIDIAAGVGTSGNVHKAWSIESASTTTATNGSTTIEFTITAGTTNSGCFIGFSEIELSTREAEEIIYKISWQKGSSYITETDDQSLKITQYSISEPLFWQFIPTGKENCYYIKNTATGNYIGSCNKEPSSQSRITTSATPVEYYVAATASTNSTIQGCHYLSSTDCSNYSNEESGPRALNKDGASDYVITWQAGASRAGSYWTLTRTEDLYEVRHFIPSSSIGSIDAIYNVGTSSKNITIEEGEIKLREKNSSDNNQGWYLVGESNQEGYYIASAKYITTTIGAGSNGTIVAEATAATRWQTTPAGNEKGAYIFKSKTNGTTLKIGNDSIFTLTPQHNAYAQGKQIYYNPCGAATNNYAQRITLTGDGVIETLTYEATSKPAKWHLLYSLDKGTVAAGENITIEATLAAADSNTSVTAHFDWNADGIFDTTCPLTLNGTTAGGTTTVPQWATPGETRMRVRVNSNGLDLADDDVYGYAYDFIITTTAARATRYVTATTNSARRGNATLSQNNGEYPTGTELTATATPGGNNSFICWKNGNTIVSTEASYTFTVQHDLALTAIFTPDPDGGDNPTTSIAATPLQADITITHRNGYITACSSEKIESITLYTTNAALVGKARGNTLSIDSAPDGIYIIKVRCAAGEKNFKFIKE